MSPARGPVLHHGQRDVTERGPDFANPGEVAIRGRGIGGVAADPVRTFAVDDAALDEPVEGGVERREAVDRETILGVVGVQEVEGVVEVDVVGVTRDRRERGCVFHLDNHFTPIDRLRARGYITQVTD